MALSHQKKIVDHLVGICPRQHGLLVAHQMGGGKTFSALMFMNNFRKTPVVIICPDFLRDLYNRESKLRMGKPLRQDTVIITYDEVSKYIKTNPNFCKGCVLIMDEAHYIVALINTLPPDEGEDIYLTLMKHPRRTLVMTGTPVYDSVLDMRILINIAAGKEVMPFRSYEYINAFTKPRYFNTVFWGYFVTAMTSTFTRSAAAVGVFAFVYMKVGNEQGYDNFGGNMLRSLIDPLYSFLNVMMKPQPAGTDTYHKFIFAKGVTMFFKHPYDGYEEYKKFTEKYGGELVFDYEKAVEEARNAGKIYDGPKVNIYKDEKLFEHLFHEIQQDKNTDERVRTFVSRKNAFIMGSTGAFFFLLALFAALNKLQLLHNWISSGNDPMFYRQMDYRKIQQAVAPFLSFYTLEPGSNGIPTSSEHEVYVLYDMFQTKLWTEMVYNFLSKENANMLGLSEGEAKYETDSTMLRSMAQESYLKFGRMISNCSAPGSFPVKFETCWNKITENNTRQPLGIVVYSDMLKGTDAFEQFLLHKQITTSFRFARFGQALSDAERERVLEEFKNREIHLVLLEAGIVEGISFLRTREMHILDPPLSFKTLAQLMGRVVRIHSHTGLPADEQHVHYYNYVATFHPKWIEYVTAAWSMLKHKIGNQIAFFSNFYTIWWRTKTARHTLPYSFKPTILESTTAEALMFRKLIPLRKLMRDLKTKISNDNLILPSISCCPRYEQDGPSEECLANHLAPCPGD